MLVYHGKGHLRVKRLTGEDVQIYIIGILCKMRRDVGCFDELHERISLLVSFSEVDDAWGTECYHINGLDKLLAKSCNGGLGTDSGMVACTCVDNKMIAPCCTKCTRCAKCTKCTVFSCSTHPMSASHKKIDIVHDYGAHTR